MQTTTRPICPRCNDTGLTFVDYGSAESGPQVPVEGCCDCPAGQREAEEGFEEMRPDSDDTERVTTDIYPTAFSAPAPAPLSTHDINKAAWILGMRGGAAQQLAESLDGYGRKLIDAALSIKIGPERPYSACDRCGQGLTRAFGDVRLIGILPGFSVEAHGLCASEIAVDLGTFAADAARYDAPGWLR